MSVAAVLFTFNVVRGVLRWHSHDTGYSRILLPGSSMVYGRWVPFVIYVALFDL